MVGSTGGGCIDIADVATELGLQFPDLTETTKTRLGEVMPDFASLGNPLDGTGAMFEDQKLFPQLLQGLVEDPNIDMIAVHVTANEFRLENQGNELRFALEIVRTAPHSNKPILAFSPVVGGTLNPEIVLPLRAAGVPYLEGTEFAMAACRNLVRYCEFSKTAQRETNPMQNQRGPAVMDLPSGVLPTSAAFRLLETSGIPVVPTALVYTADEAVSAATRIGFPVALKVESPVIQHKNDVGGVVLNLATPDAVRNGFRNIRQDVGTRAPSAKITGIFVQRMAGEGVEVILGVKQDSMFGPVIVCGLGGIFVEILRDTAIGIPPLSQEQARDLICRLRGWPILAGARGRLPSDVDALSDAIVRLSQLAMAYRDRIEALDINPLIVYPKGRGVLAVDALVQVQ